MTLFHMDDLVCSVPQGYRDDSTHALQWPAEDGSRIALLVQRDTTRERPKLEAMHQLALAEYKKRLPMLHMETEPTLDLALPHRLAAIRWKREDDVVYQLQLFIELSDRNVIATFSARALYRDAVDDMAREFATSLRIREP